ncbi:MAG: serine/threonine protein kinase [Anaerolineae bacterium]|nr:serine/threonine protein kinase [Anaerolineae bacterium]
MTGEFYSRKLGPYYIEGVVGKGTVGIVYRVLTKEGDVLALKVFVPPPAVDQELLMTRFEREAETMMRLQHPNILPVLATGHVDGSAYMAMPLIKGQALDGILKKKNRFDEVEATEIGWQIADALHYAYENGVIHRDVKPSNILITNEGHAFLADFGVAYALDDPGLTQAGHIVGTPAYMSPEQASQERKMDRQSDLYSLGVILYRLVTGKLPFSGTAPEILHAHLHEKPPAPSSIATVSPEMETIILKAMAKNPANRFADGRAMAKELLELNQLLREKNGHTSGSGLRARFNRWLTRLRA